MFLDLQTPAYAQNLVFDAAMRFGMIVLSVPMRLMKSPKYLHVVAFVPPVSLPSALDCFAATSAPVPIHTGTATSLESAISHPIDASAGTNVLVFSLICFPKLSSASSCLFPSSCGFLVDRELGNVFHEGEESRVDLPSYCVV